MCENKVSFYVPCGYDYKEVESKCGNTDPDGSRTICDDCANDPRGMAEIERQERNAEADNAWLRSAGWGEM
jgi:hypothetical protein